MSDGDVSLIRDEDVLRRMWQQTEDFSRKKEIRAHMYRLREERLRNLYSPEPSLDAAKGCEFSSKQGHVKSFADQNFQSMKSKEVRDAGSPPKEFNYRGQDLKDLSNAGWNVESENRTTDDGHTRVKSVNANIEGRYDVDGGKGHFAAADHHKQAVTEYSDGNTNLKRNEDYSNTSAHEQVERQTGDGTHITSTSSSSTSASKFEQTSSTYESVPYQAYDNFDPHPQPFNDNDINEITMKETTNISNHNQTFRNDYEHGELLSRKIEYPDDNTKVIVETRCLPDGTKVTSTRREFRAPSAQTRRSEHHSEQIKSESKSTSYISSQRKTQSNESSQSFKHDKAYNTNVQDIVDSQRNKDDLDFKNNDITDYADSSTRVIRNEKVTESANNEEQSEFTNFYDSKSVRNHDILEKTIYDRKDYLKKDTYVEDVNKSHERKQNDYYISDDNKNIFNKNVQKQEDDKFIHKDSSLEDSSEPAYKSEHRSSNETTADSVMNHKKIKEDSQILKTSGKYVHKISKDCNVKENTETRSTHQYQTTYQTDYTHRKISTDLSPTHQAWASTLRSDTPPRSTARAPSPGNKTYKSSTSSLRSSVSPDKIYKKSSSRSVSPNKINRFSPTKTPNDQTFSSTQLSSSILETKSNDTTDIIDKHLPKNKSPTRQLHSPERKSNSDEEKSSSVTPDKQSKTPRYSPNTRRSTSPIRNSECQPGGNRDSPSNKIPSRSTPSPVRHYETTPREKKYSKHEVIDRQDTCTTSTLEYSDKDVRDETTIGGKTNITERADNQPSYMRQTVSSSPKSNRSSSPTKQPYSDRKSPIKQLPSQSPDRQLYNVNKENERFIKEESKINNSFSENITYNSENNTHQSLRTSSDRDYKRHVKPINDYDKILRTSISPKKDLVLSEDNNTQTEKSHQHFTTSVCPKHDIVTRHEGKEKNIGPNKQPSRESSPIKRHESPVRIISKSNKEIPGYMQEPRVKDNENKNRSPSPIAKDTSISSNLLQKNENFKEMVKTTDGNQKVSYHSFDKNIETKSTSPQKESPRRSPSPKKRILDTKNNQTQDFIETEILNEEINKITSKKSRTLHTPSTSPSRIPKSDETAPSTGQSSPTTNSGFIHLNTEIVSSATISKKSIKTVSNDANIKEHERTPSPTKIPCRSPSPEKLINKENLPRKSSLKKPSFDNGNVISLPKPPTSFLISPENEKTNDNEKEEMPKDKANTKSDKPVKIKPPLERRETYEERCRKILGMSDDNPTKETNTTHAKSEDMISPKTSPSISPCESPVQIEEKGFSDDNYGLVNIVDLTTKSSVPMPLKTETYKSDIQISTEASCQKTAVESVIDHCQTLVNMPFKQIIASNETTLRQDTMPNKISPQNSSLPFCKPQESKTLSDNDSENGLNKTKYDKVHESTPLKPSNVSEEVKLKETISKCSASQQEQDVLDRVQSSLRKLSPDRKGKPVEDNNYKKNNSKLPILQDKTPKDESINQDSKEINNTAIVYSEDKISERKKTLVTEKFDISKNQIPSKPSSRNTSPIKKPLSPQNLTKATTETVKPRSTSPKKPMSPIEKKHISPIERPQSPQLSKTTIINTKDQHQRTSPSSTLKTERTDLKKTTKSQSTRRTSPTKFNANKTAVNNNKSQDNENKTPQKLNHSPTLKKEIDSKVIRTSSDISIKSPLKKVTPQRMKSKPEIQLNNVATNKIYKQNTHTIATKTHKSPIKQATTKLPVSKPKSATALNTSIDDDDDIIIDVQQAKSSRENSPDRICPTPVGFSEDTGTPRFPDEVNEPDDEINKRSHNIIHEAESIVDDIVEICEEDELFVRAEESEMQKLQQKSLVSDKSTVQSKETDSIISNKNQGHIDLIKGNLISDESLLSVSEKVNRFAKGPVISKDRSPSRNIKEEYDRDTIYTDDYTKLSVNDKAHLFIETAENVKTTKPKSIQKPVRPDFSNIDESLQSDECLLSVSDKVNKFVKSAVDVSADANAIEEKEKKIQEVHDNIMKRIIDDVEENLPEIGNISVPSKDYNSVAEDNTKPRAVRTSDDNITKSTMGSNKLKPDIKQSEQLRSVKITTLRSSEAVKKAKALFENIASTTKPKERTVPNRTTKLTDIGVSQKIPTTKTTQLTQDPRPTIQQTDYDEENTELSSCNRQKSPNKNQLPSSDMKKDNLPLNRATSPLRRDKSPSIRLNLPHKNDKTLIEREKSALPKSPRDESPMERTKSPILREVSPISNVRSPTAQTATIVPKKVLSRLPVTEQVDSTKQLAVENKEEKSLDKLPGYQRPTKTSQMKEERYVEEIEVSSRRGSGKFGVELRRASADRSSVSSERRRSSVEHHQPCIEDIFDLDLLEQMLEKVVGYEQRRRIRAQIRVAKKKIETEDTTKVIRNLRQSTTKVLKTKSPERLAQRSPDRLPISKKVSQNISASNRISSPERQHPKPTQVKSVSPDCQQQLTTTAGIYNEQEKTQLSLSHDHDKQINKTSKVVRAQSPEKYVQTAPKTVHQSSSDKRRPVSPSKLTSKTKGNRFSEYASAYMKKVGLPESDKLKHKVQEINESETKKMETNLIIDIHNVKTTIDRTSSKDIIEIQIEGKKSPSPHRSFDRKIVQQPRIQSSESEAFETPLEPSLQNSERRPSPNRSTMPETKQTLKKDIKSTTFGIEKKVAQKQVNEEKPSWVTSRNLKKVTTESRTFSSKKIETDKPKYRPSSPSKAITKPIDVITSSYGPGPLDADGKPLFGIKALRNGAANYQVKGTVIRQEFHSRNGSEPEGTVSVTAYSTEPEDLEKLLQTQGEKPSRLHGLAAITTTKKFGGDTGTTFREVATKEERAALEQFTHSDRRTTESQIDTHTDSLQKTDQREKIEIISNKTQNQKRSHQMVQSSLKKETKKDFDQKVTRSDRMQKAERRVEDRKTVRQNSVKSLTEKFIKNASETTKTERQVYPKAGLILRTAGMKDSVSSDSSAHAGLARTDSEHSLASVEDMMTTTTTTTEQLGDILRTTTTVTKTGGQTQERSFLDSSTKVTGVQDILTRMKNADIVIEEGDSNEDSEARALLNKFLGATVLMAGMQNYVTESAPAKQERSKGGVDKFGGRQREDVDIEQCWDERVLRKLLDECTDYELRRRLRTRIRALMAEQEACASAVTEALAAAGETVESAETEEHQQAGEREKEEIINVTSSVRRNSTEQTVSSTTITNTKVIESRPVPKPVSPFAKFRQLEKQNSVNSPNSPKTPQSPGSPSQPYFKFTDPALQLSAVTIKERLLQWCRDKTRDYENVKLENFSTSWADGLAFCALLHHFLPDAFDYAQLTPDKRRHNFTLAFKIADEKAGIYPLLDVDDMVSMRKPDWKCVFTYVQSIHRRFKDEL